MHSRNARFELLPRRLRLAAAAAAVLTAAGLNAAVLLGFGLSGPAIWLVPDAELLAQSAACERWAGRQQRLRCKQQLVAARLNGTPAAHRLAER